MTLLFMCIKQKRDLKKKIYSYNFGWFLCEFITIFFATGIRFHVAWSGSGSGPRQMIWIRPDPDPDPKHCFILIGPFFLLTGRSLLMTGPFWYTDVTILSTAGPFLYWWWDCSFYWWNRPFYWHTILFLSCL